MALVAAVLAALRLAEHSGQGQVVDVTLGMAAWTMASDLAAPLVDGRQPTIRDRRHMVSPLANRFRCADERWIVLNMPEPHWWPRFCEAMGRPQWVVEPRFETVKSRFDHMTELIDLIDTQFATKTLAEWGRIFDERGLIWGPAATVAELAADPQAEAAGLHPEIHHPDGTFRTVAAPFRIADADVRPRGPGGGPAHSPDSRGGRFGPRGDRGAGNTGCRRSAGLNSSARPGAPRKGEGVAAGTPWAGRAPDRGEPWPRFDPLTPRRPALFKAPIPQRVRGTTGRVMALSASDRSTEPAANVPHFASA